MHDNLTYSIGHVAEMVGVSTSTLRYWETVIERLKPQKTNGGSRRYTTEDIELIRQLKVLLHDRGMTIKGVNRLLADAAPLPLIESRDFGTLQPDVDQSYLKIIHSRLIDIKNTLNNSFKAD
ncbi:MAG: MerR family transcriptional regulator [Calditrichaeota bacterium]|nr:MAG: MerR family transcriptional regulator [Calditrichota bacterium]